MLWLFCDGLTVKHLLLTYWIHVVAQSSAATLVNPCVGRLDVCGGGVCPVKRIHTETATESDWGRCLSSGSGQVFLLQNRVQTSLISDVLLTSVSKHKHGHKNTHSQYCCRFTTGHFITTPTTLFLYSQSSVRFYFDLICSFVSECEF